MPDEQTVIITDLFKGSLDSTSRNTKSSKTMKRLDLFTDFVLYCKVMRTKSKTKQTGKASCKS